MKTGKGTGAVSRNAVAQARHAKGTRSPSAPPPTLGKGHKITAAVRGAGD